VRYFAKTAYSLKKVGIRRLPGPRMRPMISRPSLHALPSLHAFFEEIKHDELLKKTQMKQPYSFSEFGCQFAEIGRHAALITQL
jgi:hypothetical protein